MEPMVSVIIPTHKGSSIVRRAVDSVLKQTYKNIEIIVVDDNGLFTDEQIKTEKALEQYINDNKIKYIPHEHNINGSAARNTGAKYAKGKFITLLDDDDEYLPEKVEMQVECFNKLSDEYGLVYCGIQIDYGEKTLCRRPLAQGDLFKDLLFHNVVIGSDTLMVRTDYYREINGFDESFKRHQDFEFTARISYKWKIMAIDKIGVKSYELNRNNPTKHDLKVLYRTHYIKKMIPYMSHLDRRTKRDIICTNFIMLHGNDLRQLRLLSVFKSVKNEVKDFISDYNTYDYFRSIILVEWNKVYGKKKRVSIEWR